jgi:UPF0716 protein FxsA
VPGSRDLPLRLISVLLLLMIFWPMAEIVAAVEVGRAIGVLPMVLLLIASWPLGLWVLGSQGRAAWRRLVEAIAAGRPPGREVLDGALVLIGGALLIIPGFITDAIGVLLLLPPLRKLTRRFRVLGIQRRVFVRAARVGRPRRAYDVDSTATDLDKLRLQR